MRFQCDWFWYTFLDNLLDAKPHRTGKLKSGVCAFYVQFEHY